MLKIDIDGLEERIAKEKDGAPPKVLNELERRFIQRKLEQVNKFREVMQQTIVALQQQGSI